jgi:hypothetical protein
LRASKKLKLEGKIEKKKNFNKRKKKSKEWGLN